jgi:hypothetical protein
VLVGSWSCDWGIGRIQPKGRIFIGSHSLPPSLVTRIGPPGALRGSLGSDSPPKSVSKGARFWGFSSSRVCGALGGISSIPPFWMSFDGIKLGYGLLMRCS